MKADDIKIGDKFGKLTVISSFFRNKKNNKKTFTCRCDCGIQKDIECYNLSGGHTKSCGCLKTVQIGEKYNRLTIVTFDGKDSRNNQYVICSCECGTKNIKAHATKVKTGRKKSCGCANIKHDVGAKFGRLTIIGKAETVNKKTKSRKVRCSCECGKEKIVMLCDLIGGSTKSCGCLAIESRMSKDPWLTIFNSMKWLTIFNSMKESSVVRSTRILEWNLDRYTFEKILKSNCHYCGTEPSTRTKVGNLKRNGIDRLDNTKGYIIGNCVPCCYPCNVAKRQMTLEEFKNWLTRAYKKIVLGDK